MVAVRVLGGRRARRDRRIVAEAMLNDFVNPEKPSRRLETWVVTTSVAAGLTVAGLLIPKLVYLGDYVLLTLTP